MLNTIRMKINGFEFPMRDDATILEASREAYGARQWDIEVPTLNYMPGLQEVDESGLCVVEVAGQEGLVNASTTKVADGMEVQTRTPAVMAAQTEVLGCIMAKHDQDCANCHRTGNCELQDIVWRQVFVTDPNSNKHKDLPLDTSTIVVRDPNKCVACGRCVATCQKVQEVRALEMQGEGREAKVVYANGAPNLAATTCINCGQCIEACPVGALYERDDTAKVFEALADDSKFVVVQSAPSVRVALGEAFNFPVGAETEGRMAAALRALGFDRVYDTVLGADMTIMEEAHELIGRIEAGEHLPQFTSCCPGWIKFCEQEYPELLDNLSSCKSPHQMLGAITKKLISEQEGVALEDIVMVSIMPCTAKKFEITREDENANGVPDVDVVLTTRELARMLDKKRIWFSSFAPEPFDNPLGEGTGAGVIFGATGGVMEAALRTAADTLNGAPVEKLEYTAVRGTSGIKEAEVVVGEHTLRVAIASGLANARKLAEEVAAGKSPYDFIEIMACPGGCVAGGGQPQHKARVWAEADIRAKRAAALYSIDERDTIRKSHENPMVKELYATYFGEPGSEVAHEMLHTTYVNRA